MRTSQSNVPIVELALRSALTSKNSLRLEAIPTIQSAAHHVAKPGRQGLTETVATDHHARCFLRHVPSAARIPKYPLNLAKADRCIVATAIVKSELVDRELV